MKANPVDIFNYVIESLPSGETLVIKGDNEKQVDRLRMSLIRQRSKLEKIVPHITSVITISKRTENKDYAVIVGKNIEEFNLTITDADGNERPLELKPKVDLAAQGRMRKLMLDDGKSEEEIEEYFQRGEK